MHFFPNFISDLNGGKLKKLLNIDHQKCDSLYGFTLIGYKEYIFLFGGEFLIGKGNWNTNMWVYDSIRERWERKCVLVRFVIYNSINSARTVYRLNAFSILMPIICSIAIVFCFRCVITVHFSECHL